MAPNNGDRRELLGESSNGLLTDHNPERVDIDVPAGQVMVEFIYYTSPAASFIEIIELT